MSTNTVYVSETYAHYAAVRDQIEEIAAAATAMLTAAEQLDRDCWDHLTPERKLEIARDLLAGFWAAT